MKYLVALFGVTISDSSIWIALPLSCSTLVHLLFPAEVGLKLLKKGDVFFFIELCF